MENISLDVTKSSNVYQRDRFGLRLWIDDIEYEILSKGIRNLDIDGDIVLSEYMSEGILVYLSFYVVKGENVGPANIVNFLKSLSNSKDTRAEFTMYGFEDGDEVNFSMINLRKISIDLGSYGLELEPSDVEWQMRFECDICNPYCEIDNFS